MPLHLFQRTLQKAVEEAARLSLAAFLTIAAGSASELEYHLLLARDLKYLNDLDYGQLTDLVIEIKRMLTSLIQKLKAES